MPKTVKPVNDKKADQAKKKAARKAKKAQKRMNRTKEQTDSMKAKKAKKAALKAEKAKDRNKQNDGDDRQHDIDQDSDNVAFHINPNKRRKPYDRAKAKKRWLKNPAKNPHQFTGALYQGTVLLSFAMPRSGFVFPQRNQITSRAHYDSIIQTAIRNTGITGFDRVNMLPLLVTTFEPAAVSCYAAYVADPDDSKDTALYGAIDTCQRGMAWAAEVPPVAFADLLLHIRAARRRFLEICGFDDTEPGTWGRSLGVAVDKFDEAVLHRGWGRTHDILALEEVEDDDDEYDGRMEEEICDGVSGMDINARDDQQDEGEEEEVYETSEEKEVSEEKEASEEQEAGEEKEAGEETGAGE